MITVANAEIGVRHILLLV